MYNYYIKNIHHHTFQFVQRSCDYLFPMVLDAVLYSKFHQLLRDKSLDHINLLKLLKQLTVSKNCNDQFIICTNIVPKHK